MRSPQPEIVTIVSAGHALYGKSWEADREAPTLVLLCGLGFHTFEYDLLAPHLCAAGYNCLTFDYRGHGRSEGRRGDWTLQDLSDDVRRAVDLVARRHRGRIGAFGNSLGAMTAILTATLDERIASVVASNCPARLADFMLTPLRSALYRVAKMASRVIPLHISVNHFYSYDQLIGDARWVETIRRDPRITAARRLSLKTYASLLEDWDAMVTATRVGTPLLLVQGSKDALQPARESERIHEAAPTRSTLVRIDTGHLPHLEAPEPLARIVAQWFAETLG